LVSFTFSIAASADVVQLCYTNSLGHTGCCYATGVCANINCPPGWTCADISSTAVPIITKTSGGGATMTINGTTLPIASEAFEAAFHRLSQQYLEKNADKKAIAKELSDLWTKPDSWKVSDRLLERYAKEFHVKIGTGSGGTSSSGK
jgi:hypothetical protein